MTTENVSSSVKATGSTRKRGKAKYIALLVVALAVFIAAQTGFLGFGLARLRATTFPRDESLLEYVPGTAGAVAIIDPHQIVLKELGAEGGTLRQNLDRIRDGIAKATGIDLVFDVDKLVFSPSLVVMRGRVNERKLAERLAEYGYVPAEYKIVKYLLRSGEDAVASVDGSILLYGGEAEIRAAIDAKEAGTSLSSREEVTSRLSSIGWDHPMLGVVLLADSKPSLRTIIGGSTGPRAVTVGVSMKGGLSVQAAIDAASPDTAEELRKLLEEKRADVEGLKSLVGPEVGASVGELIKRAKLTRPENSSQLAVQVDLRPEEIDALAKSSSSLGAMYKNVRLLQLLSPSL